jgi:hypothetical protein
MPKVLVAAVIRKERERERGRVAVHVTERARPWFGFDGLGRIT